MFLTFDMELFHSWDMIVIVFSHIFRTGEIIKTPVAPVKIKFHIQVKLLNIIYVH